MWPVRLGNPAEGVDPRDLLLSPGEKSSEHERAAGHAGSGVLGRQWGPGQAVGSWAGSGVLGRQWGPGPAAIAQAQDSTGRAGFKHCVLLLPCLVPAEQCWHPWGRALAFFAPV